MCVSLVGDRFVENYRVVQGEVVIVWQCTVLRGCIEYLVIGWDRVAMVVAIVLDLSSFVAQLRLLWRRLKITLLVRGVSVGKN